MRIERTPSRQNGSARIRSPGFRRKGLREAGGQVGGSAAGHNGASIDAKFPFSRAR